MNTADYSLRTVSISGILAGVLVFAGCSSDEVAVLDTQVTAAGYDFENLAEGNINGQDNWLEATTNATVVTDTTAANGSKVVRPNSLVAGAAGQTEMTRVNDASFSFTPVTASAVEIWFDATADDNAIFALGQDIDGNGMLAENSEIGIPFGIWERQFAILTANSLIVRAGVADLGTNNEATDWYRLRLRIDFAANGGEGTGSLAYMNLSNGETVFTEIAGLQDLNLRLLSNAAPDLASWNAMFLLLRIDATNIPKADNLLPNVPVITQ